MSQNIEMHDGRCELCNSMNHPENLYVDLFNNQWSLVCPKCFYNRNQNKDKAFYTRVVEILPDIMTADEFYNNKNKTIAIGNTYPYFIQGAKRLAKVDKAFLVDKTLAHFYSLEKLHNKFIAVQVKSKCSEQLDATGLIFLVAIVAKVKFKSYVEYLEHMLFAQFRKECKTILN